MMADDRQIHCPELSQFHEFSIESEVDSWLIDPDQQSVQTFSDVGSRSTWDCFDEQNEDSESNLLKDQDTTAAKEALRRATPALDNAPGICPVTVEVWNVTMTFLHATADCLHISKQCPGSWITEVAEAAKGLLNYHPSCIDIKAHQKRDQPEDFSNPSTGGCRSQPHLPSTMTIPKPRKRLNSSTKRHQRVRVLRRSNPCNCFLCEKVLSNKRNLIKHLKLDHGIERSQSLMYKRIKQGEETIKRLYVTPLKIYRRRG